jgi:hypothetical protein
MRTEPRIDYLRSRNMKPLKYALIFFFAVDAMMFLVSQASPDLFVSLLPQFDMESAGNTYPRLVGFLFLMLGLARLYGAVFIKEKGAIVLSMWSWIVELAYLPPRARCLGLHP